MTRERPHPPFGFECPYQHNCPHMSGMSAHHAHLVVNQAPHERSELYQRIDAYRKDLEEAHQRIGELKKESAYFKAQWQLLHRKQFKANKPPHQGSTPSSSSASGSSPLPKKRGALKGHPGWHRKKPQHVDQTVEVPAPQKCPHCAGQSLQSIPERWEHLQEDILLQPRTHVTRFDHAQAYCPCCDRQVVATAEGEILNAPIGPVAKATATYLRFSLGLPYRKIQRLFESLFGLKFVPASAFGFDRLAASKGEALHEDLRQKIHASSVIYADETHWRVDGVNHSLWYAGNDDLAYYHVDRHRSSEAAQYVLGERFHGVLVCDSYAAYHATHPRARQACLAHYLRDCREIVEKLDQLKQQGFPDDSQARTFAQNVSTVFKQACAFGRFSGCRRSRKRIRMRKHWTRQLHRYCSKNLIFHDAETFRRRLVKEQGQWSTFLRFPNIDPTNNHAERSLRPSVIFRKITFGNRSATGSHIHGVVSSLIHTASRQQIDPMLFLQTLLTKSTPAAQAALYKNTS